jgi:hypothetical protein
MVLGFCGRQDASVCTLCSENYSVNLAMAGFIGSVGRKRGKKRVIAISSS